MDRRICFCPLAKRGAISQSPPVSDYTFTLLRAHGFEMQWFSFLQHEQFKVKLFWNDRLTWWHVMSKADQTNMPERAWAATVFKKIWSSMIDPLLVWIIVVFEMCDLSGRIGAGRWTIESFSDDDSMSSKKTKNKNTHSPETDRKHSVGLTGEI